MLQNLTAVILFLGLSFAQAFEVPAFSNSVVDTVGFLDSSTQDKLSNALKVIYEKGGPQLAVLTVESIDSLTIEEASYKVVKSWQLGTAQKDNGILLMIAKKERKLRIEVGQGVEGDLTDAYSRRIIDEQMVPLFRNGDTTAGILVGVDAILKRMNPPYHLEEFLDIPYRAQKQVQVDWAHLALMIGIFLFLMWINGHGGGGGRRMAGAAGLGGFYGGGGFGGSSGGGSWSGGGGGFSGGGASGSW